MLRAIVWSLREFRAACDGLAEAVDDRSSVPLPRSRERRVELWQVAGLPVGCRGVARWFETRYRAHPPPVALLHLDRFVEVWRFIDLHRPRLLSEGLISVHPTDGTVVEDALLTALVSVDYRPGFLCAPEERSIGSLDDVLALARAVSSGRVEVVEFQRHQPELPRVPAGDADAFEPDELEDALAKWYALRGRPVSEVREEADRFWRRVGRDHGDVLERSPVLAVLLAWFTERFDDRRSVGVLFLRFLVMAGFIEEHRDRLAELGFLELLEGRPVLTGSLFSVLSNLPLVPAQGGGAEVFQLDELVAAARAHDRGGSAPDRRRAPSQTHHPRNSSALTASMSRARSSWP